MRFFVCLLAPDGHGPSDTVRRRYESLPRGRDLDFAWHSSEGADVLTAWDDPYGDPLIVRNGDDIAVGVVRLDNRKEVQHWADVRGPGVTDLALVLHTVHRHGIKYIPHLLGDFAFVVWSGRSRTAIAATDAFCIKRLFHAERDGLIAFASRAEALALEPRYDIEYLSERVSQCLRSEHLTVYTGVRKLPAGTFGVLERGRLSQRRYWSADDFAPEAFRPKLEREAPRRCRELFIDSVQHRLAGNDETWAQLSGGLDSSSIVSTAQWLAGKGDTSYRLAGTITYVDWQETDADEREYSDTVADRWHIRNEVIVDPPIWFDDHPPPPLDQPSDFLAFYPRERRLCGVVRGSGGRVLLAGFGSDELFTGSALFLADWIALGRVAAAAREIARWAAMGRISFWQVAYGSALLPLLPAALRRQSFVEPASLPSWIPPALVRQYGLRARSPGVVSKAGRPGRKYQDAITTSVKGLTTELDAGLIGDTLDVRYPFLYRPLVEFALTLPPELCARPHARKWVVREAMRDILPEKVRTRIGKGAPTDVLVRSLTTQRSLLEPLVRRSILADLGVIDEAQLQTAFETAPSQKDTDGSLSINVQNTLMVEAWLRMRAGRWP